MILVWIVAAVALLGMFLLIGQRYYIKRHNIFVIPKDLEVVLRRAGDLIGRTNEDMANASGEAKRHAVYARLLKEFPQNSHNDCALAIELAIQKTK